MNGPAPIRTAINSGCRLSNVINILRPITKMGIDQTINCLPPYALIEYQLSRDLNAFPLRIP